MPNWCYNELTLTLNDGGKGLNVLQAFSGDEPFNKIRPNPDGHWDYNWSCENWGTKWDVQVIESHALTKRNGVWLISVTFDSAWSPPHNLYQYISDTYPDVELDAYWEEPGCGQKGTYYAHEGMFSNQVEDYEVEEDDPEEIPTTVCGSSTILPLP